MNSVQTLTRLLDGGAWIFPCGEGKDGKEPARTGTGRKWAWKTRKAGARGIQNHPNIHWGIVPGKHTEKPAIVVDMDCGDLDNTLQWFKERGVTPFATIPSQKANRFHIWFKVAKPFAEDVVYWTIFNPDAAGGEVRCTKGYVCMPHSEKAYAEMLLDGYKNAYAAAPAFSPELLAEIDVRHNRASIEVSHQRDSDGKYEALSPAILAEAYRHVNIDGDRNTWVVPTLAMRNGGGRYEDWRQINIDKGYWDESSDPRVWTSPSADTSELSVGTLLFIAKQDSGWIPDDVEDTSFQIGNPESLECRVAAYETNYRKDAKERDSKSPYTNFHLPTYTPDGGKRWLPDTGPDYAVLAGESLGNVSTEDTPVIVTEHDAAQYLVHQAEMAFEEDGALPPYLYHQLFGWYIWVSGAGWKPINLVGLGSHLASILYHKVGGWTMGKEPVFKVKPGRAGTKGFGETVARKLAEYAVFCPNIKSWDADPWKLSHPDGTYTWLPTMERKEALPSDLLTLHTAVIPADEVTDIPWMDTVRRCFPDQRIREYILSWYGAAIIGEQRTSIFLGVEGRAGQGKTTIIEGIIYALGDDLAGTLDESAILTSRRGGGAWVDGLKAEAGKLSLARRRLMSIQELNARGGVELSMSILNSMVDGGAITVRPKGQDSTQVMPVSSLCGDANTIVPYSTENEGTTRRLRKVRVSDAPVPVGERDKNFIQELRRDEKQLGVILRMLIEYCADFIAHGCTLHTEPPEVRVWSEDWANTRNIIKYFMATFTKLDTGAKLRCTELREDILSYVKENGVNVRGPLLEALGSDKQFVPLLRSYDFPIGETSRTSSFVIGRSLVDWRNLGE